MIKTPKLSSEEWVAIANKLAREGWLADSYNAKNGQRHWQATKWGEKHYQMACKVTGVQKLFGGKTLKELEKADLEFKDLGDSHLYELKMITEVFDDETNRGKKELTREGYEWLYAYTKLKGKKLTSYQAKNQIVMTFEAILQMIFMCFYSLSSSRRGKNNG